jgi:DNA-binding transcriptional LysR family regulator
MTDHTRHLFSPALRYFAAVARYGSFRAAARELNVASSAVNRQILGLEADLGVALFERIGRKIRLSPSGELLLRHVTDTFRDFEAVAGEIDALKGLRRGRVSIATVESVAQDLLPDIVHRFTGLHPGIDVAVTTAGSEEATRLVLAGEVDIGLTFNPNGGRALELGLRRVMRIGAVVAPDHPVAALPVVRVADCLRYPLAIPSKGLSIRAALDGTAAMRLGSHRIAVETNTLAFMRALARRGRHVAFQTMVGLGGDLAAGTLVFRPLADPDLAADRFALVSRADRTLKLAAATFHSFAVRDLMRLFPADDAETATMSA